MFKKILFLMLFTGFCASNLYAETSVDCDSECPEGKKMSSFADGNTVNCICVEDAEMDETVADPDVATEEDPNNTH